MYRPMLSLVFLLAFQSFVFAQQPQRMQWSEQGYFSAEVPEGLIYVEVQSPIVYTLKGGSSVFGVFANVYRMPTATKITREALRNSVVKDGYFTLNGSVVRVSYNAKESTSVTVPDTLNGGFIFPKAGECLIVLDVGKSKLQIPINVVALNVSQNDPAALFVENYGEPDRKEEVAVRWPDSELKHTIFYKPEAGKGPIIATHWMLKKMPNLVVSIVESKIYDVGSVSLRNSQRMEIEELESQVRRLESRVNQPMSDPKAEKAEKISDVIKEIIWGSQSPKHPRGMEKLVLKKYKEELEQVGRYIKASKITAGLSSPMTFDPKKKRIEFDSEESRTIATDHLKSLSADIPK
jgi:hypothetical protein